MVGWPYEGELIRLPHLEVLNKKMAPGNNWGIEWIHSDIHIQVLKKYNASIVYMIYVAEILLL